MTTTTRSNRFAAPLLAASFALLALVSGCSGSFAQPADFPHARDFTPPARERTAAYEHSQTTQAPAAARAFERAERAPATPRARPSGRRGDF